MRVFLDEGVPEKLGRRLSGHQVTSVGSLGCKGTVNGALLAIIEEHGFEVFITNDQRMEYDQNLIRRPFGILLLSTNHWPTMKSYVAVVVQAVSAIKAGEVRKLFVGTFVPSRFRKPSL